MADPVKESDPPPDHESFPMLDGPPITWRTARLIYKVYGNSQSLERIAERGGFGWGEVELMCDRYIQAHGQSSYDNLWANE